MNRNASHAQASQFGPPSDSIHIGDFLHYALDSQSHSVASSSLFAPEKTAIAGWADWTQLTDNERASVEMDCNVAEIKSVVDDTMNDPRLATHVMRMSRAVATAIHDAADTSTVPKPVRKRAVPDPEEEHADVAALQNTLDEVSLKSWKLDMKSAIFMRTPAMLFDYNALTKVKELSPETVVGDAPECLVIFSIHTHIRWSYNFTTRTSQHALLASQTLGDLYESIPCTSNEMPEEILDEDGQLIGYNDDVGKYVSSGCVICIEGVAYGDGQSEEDYSEKLLQQISSLPENRQSEIKKGSNMHNTSLSSLTVRLNKPYWLMHAGNCEHYIIIDEIRLKHPADPPSGYPLTLAILPTNIHTCRGCARVPGVWSITGDMRLGESPCVLCGPCWRNMGLPKDVKEGKVVVSPLPKYELGW